MVLSFIKLTSLNDFPLEEGPISQMKEPVSRTSEFKQSLHSFYITESPLCVTTIAQMAMFYLN